MVESYINLDKNMVVNTTIGDVEVRWFDVRQSPFSLHGFCDPQTEPYFHRVPAALAAEVSEGVDRLSRESAGGRVRFSTDSPYIAIRAKFRAVGRSPHLTLISTAGFDLYRDGEFGSVFVKEFRMPYEMTDSYEQILYTHTEKKHTYTINFPVHSVVETLEVGLKPGAVLNEARPYRDILPAVIYGSSIVHGTAATRPGLTYPAILSRMLDIDYFNIGFSGNARGESNLVRWMATIPMSVFVCDYDYNAPNVEHLDKTHYPMYEMIREKNPDVPYVMITKPSFWQQPSAWEDTLRRRDVVLNSYLKARSAGDQNVYFIDGLSFYPDAHLQDFSVDTTHPNDAGFIRMADVIGTTLRHIYEKKSL